jgi:hypothetical protein
MANYLDFDYIFGQHRKNSIDYKYKQHYLLHDIICESNLLLKQHRGIRLFRYFDSHIAMECYLFFKLNKQLYIVALKKFNRKNKADVVSIKNLTRGIISLKRTVKYVVFKPFDFQEQDNINICYMFDDLMVRIKSIWT